MHQKNRMIAMVPQTKLMPVSYEQALEQAMSVLDEVRHNLHAWPSTRQQIRVPANFVFQPVGVSMLRPVPPVPDDHPLLPLAYEVTRAHEALDTILNSFHFTCGGVYSLDYHPRMPEMAGHDSDPWVTAYTMTHPADKSAFRAALHAMLTTIELMKSADLDTMARHSDAIAALYHEALQHLSVRNEFYFREHHPEAAVPSNEYAFDRRSHRTSKASAAA